jgi:selenocysteine lyase/cysteine desulfurase
LKEETINAFAELGKSVFAALETYSNVHRGSGHKSMISTYLYEQARGIVLEFLGLDKNKYVVIFCSPLRAEDLRSLLKEKNYKIISSRDIGLNFGIRALAVKRKALPRGVPFQTGGGTTRLVSPGWVVWANAPDRFEAGTPAIISVIALARALQLIRQYGKDIFLNTTPENKLSANDILYHDELEEYSGKYLLDELCKRVIGRSFQVPTTGGTKSYVNLDYAASTPALMPVWNAVCQTWHQSAQTNADIIREVRSVCADALGAPQDKYDLIFTSNTTEAINIAAQSLSRGSEPGIEPVVLNTLLEHNSNDLPWRMIPNSLLIRMHINDDGFVDLNELEEILSAYNQLVQHGKKRIRLVSVSGASNVLGIFNDLTEIGRIVHKYNACLLADAAQMVAHCKVEIEKSGIDYFSFSAHKVYAPFGCGVLIVRKGLLNLSADTMDLVQSSGEENSAGIAALGKSLVLMRRVGLDLIRDEEKHLTAKVLRGLMTVPNLTIYGIKDPVSPAFSHKGGVIVFSLQGIYANTIAGELAERGGIGIRYGCHCAHILIKHLVGVGSFLERFQRIMATLIPAVRFPGLARVSIGIGSSEEDIDRLITVLNKIARKQVRSDTGIKQKMNDFTKEMSRKVFAQY